MFGLDDKIASLGAGETFIIVAAVAVLLGLRHATDPDHLAAVTTLIAGHGRHNHRKARALGFV
jgi:high-affinity nickel permease